MPHLADAERGVQLRVDSPGLLMQTHVDPGSGHLQCVSHQL